MAAGTSNAAPVTENVTNNEGMADVSVSLEDGIIFCAWSVRSLFIVMEVFYKKETWVYILEGIVFFP